MVRLIAPNGVVVDVREDAAERLQNAGWKRAEEKKPRATTRRRTSRNSK